MAWAGLASDRRFKPRWWQRYAYAAGLRDAARIVEKETWAPDRPIITKRAINEVLERAKEFGDESYYRE